MGYKIVWESLKFHRLKSDRWVKLWFVLLIVIRAATTMLPIGDRNFTFLNHYLDGTFLETRELILPTPENWLVLGLYAACSLIALLFILLYADVFLLENKTDEPIQLKLDGSDLFIMPFRRADPYDTAESFRKRLLNEFKPVRFQREGLKYRTSQTEKQEVAYVRTAINDVARAIPGNILFVLLMIFILLISSPLLMLPFLFLFTMFSFVPVNLTFGRHRLVRSMELSSQQTGGAKFMILMILILQRVLLSLANSLIGTIFIDYHYSYLIIETFFFALKTLAAGRLLGMLYLMIGLRRPYQLASKTN